MDFNGLVRHYYLRQGDDVAEVRINLAGKKNRRLQSHAIGLRMRNELQAIADRHHARMKLVETPPGPPVIASVVAEVYGQPDHRYEDILLAADAVRARLAVEPGVVDVDHVREAAQQKIIFVSDKEKAALNGITTEQIAATLQIALGERAPWAWCGATPSEIRCGSSCGFPWIGGPARPTWRRVQVKGSTGQLVPLAELGDGKRPASTR